MRLRLAMHTVVPDGAGKRTQRDQEERERETTCKERERENGKRESEIVCKEREREWEERE